MSETPDPGAQTPAPAPPTDPVNKLDATLLVGVLLIVGGGVAALVFANIPKDNLAILASLLASLLSAVIAGYAGYRWGASQGQRATQPGPTLK
jgi:hypothetical protein